MKFSGHESFYCKNYWLKKGYDFVVEGKNFNDENAVVTLGVGKNMVASIKFWLRAFNLTDNNNNKTILADKIFSNEGYDPYLENINTLWLLHYYLVTSEFTSIYSIVFNEFRKERFEFKKENLFQYLKNKCELENFLFNENTINTDISVFFRTYLKPEKSNSNSEEDYTSLLIDLNLLSTKTANKSQKDLIYQFNIDDKNEIAPEIFLFLLLERYTDDVSIDFNELLQSVNNLGSVFCISKDGLLNKINQISTKFPFVIFTDDAGIKQIQFKGVKPDKWEVLDFYYKTN